MIGQVKPSLCMLASHTGVPQINSYLNFQFSENAHVEKQQVKVSVSAIHVGDGMECLASPFDLMHP